MKLKEIRLKFHLMSVPKCPNKNMPGLFLMIVWGWSDNKPLSEPSMVRVRAYTLVTVDCLWIYVIYLPLFSDLVHCSAVQLAPWRHHVTMIIIVQISLRWPWQIWKKRIPNKTTHYRDVKKCLPNRLFRRRSTKAPKLRVTSRCAGNSPMTGEFDDVIMRNVIHSHNKAQQA